MSDFPGVLRVGDLDISVEVSPRRSTVRLTVERDATVTAVVPPDVSAAALAHFVRAKRRWLYGKLAERRELSEPRVREYVSGEGFFYLGRSHRLLLVDGGPEVRLVRGRLEIRRDCVADAPLHIAGWYRRVGEPWLGRRVKPWAERMGVTVARLRVLPLGYRWGSCSPEGRVNIHWATMQLPPELVDYVLVHELAHVKRPDHGSEFWRVVELAMPDYEGRRDRLRRTGPELWLP